MDSNNLTLSLSPSRVAGATAVSVTLLAWAVMAAGPRDAAIHCSAARGAQDLAAATRNLRAAENHAQKVAFGGSFFQAAKIGPIPGPAYESAQAAADEDVRLARNAMRDAQAACAPLGSDAPGSRDLR